METSDAGISTADEQWMSRGWNGKFYWYRTIERCNETWYQCGISANDRSPSSGRPSHFFTCKVMPREGYTERKVMKACEDTATALKFHRGPTGGRCHSCDFRYVQEVCMWGNYSMSRGQFRAMMKRHDQVCSCGCFDVECYAISTNKTSKSQLALDQELQPSNNLSVGKWTFNPEGSSSCNAYWTRTVKSGDEIWKQYGVSKDSQTPSNDKPDFFFTCKGMPRGAKSEQFIRWTCQIAASFMRKHRRRGYYNCACTFETLRARDGKCAVSRRHLITRFLAHVVKCVMKKHDELCSCGCFDVLESEN